MRVLKRSLTGVAVGMCLMTSGVSIPNVYANERVTMGNDLVTKAEADLDVSTGWNVTDFSSSLGADVDSIFSQEHINEDLNQKMAMANFASIGESTFTAERIIHLEKGRTYSFNLVYAMEYTMGGSGYIDFNGDRRESDSTSEDKKYEKEITPTEDMDYKIVIHYDVPKGANGYFKVGYDLDKGGITVDESKLEAPIVSPQPEASTKLVTGTAVAGNTITVKDSEETVLGTAVVGDDGRFSVTTSRILRYKETLFVTQKNAKVESEPIEVIVVKTSIPNPPIINKVTDEDTVVTGTAEPLSNLNLTVGEDKYEVNVDENGDYKVSLEHTYPGLTEITGYVTDEANNQSEVTTATIVFAKPLSFTVNYSLSSIDQNISGVTSRPNCLVKVHFGQRIYLTQSDSTGKFEINLDHTYSAGTDYTVEVVHELSEESVEKDYKVLPRTPSFTDVKAGASDLTGLVDPGAIVNVSLYSDEQKLDFKATADEKGVFKIDLVDANGNAIKLKIGDRLVGTSTLTDLDLSSEEVEINVYTR